MGFSGGGSNVLKPHKHSSAVQDGSPLNMNNVTEATLNAADIVYSDGSALQPLSIGLDAQVLGVSGGTPTWITNTSNPLVKVTKTFADIVASEIDIYTLPQDAALTNVYTDITTVFDVATSVTIGDTGDNNGFAEATDWTAGTGLTDATRGAYITSFKTMRSTSGTTDIKAYLAGAPTALTKDNQAHTESAVAGTTITESGFTVGANANRILIVCAGVQSSTQTISGVTWNGVENFTRAVFSDGSGGNRAEIWYLVNPTSGSHDVVTTWGTSVDRKGSGVYSYYNAAQTTPIGVTATDLGLSFTSTGAITPTTTGSLIVDCELGDPLLPPTDTLTAGWSAGLTTLKSFASQYDLTPTISVSNNMFYTYAINTNWCWCGVELKAAAAVPDTQGEVDFYLQVVD